MGIPPKNNLAKLKTTSKIDRSVIFSSERSCMLKKAMRLALLPAAAAVLVACGGGGGGSPVASTNSFGGTAAVGAPLRAAQIEVYDLQGQRIAQTQTEQNGKYQIQLPTGAQGPFIIKAIYADEALFSVYSGQGGVANISHLTDAVTAMLSPSGASDGFMTGSPSSTMLSEAKISEAMAKLNAAISPVKDVITDMPANANFMSTAFDANGTGIDRLLDAASVSVTAKSVNNQNAVNVGVAFNIAQGLNVMNASKFVAFDSTQSANTIRTRAAALSVNASQLPPTGIGQMYNDLLDRLNACYAIPLTQRVSGDNITHQNCKDVFFNSDPSQYKDGGFNVRQRFTSLFTSPGPIRFTPTLSPIIAQDLQGPQSSGTALVANKGEDNLGNFAYNRFYVKKFSLNGRDVLGVVGDQNDFEFYVNSENDHRSFPMSSVDLDLLQSQFALIVRLPSSARVNARAAVVEGPGGRFLMRPVNGRDNFQLCRQLAENEQVTPTVITEAQTCSPKPPLLVYAARFVNQQVARSSSARPSIQSPLEFDYINNDFFVVKRGAALMTDDEIRDIPNGAPWNARVYFSNNTTKDLFTHNVSRPMTTDELMGADSPINRAARLTNMTMSEGPSVAPRTVDFSAPRPLLPNIGIPAWAQRNQDAYNRFNLSHIPVWAPVDGGFQFTWSVAPGQIPPFILFMSGQVNIDWEGRDLPTTINSVSKPVQPMEDQVRFAVGRRQATLFCTPTPFITTPNDESCDLDLATNSYYRDADNQYRYNPGARMTSTSLISRDQQQRTIIRGYHWFIPTAGGVRVNF